ncbi:MAG: cytosine permease [Clostridiales bacterium]|nr:cytosine permease [Clostridiales bacterium]
MADKVTQIEKTTLNRVPENEKKSWGAIAFIWAGSVICVPALMVGGMISAGLTFGQSVVSMIIGYIIVVCYMILIGIQSSDLGVPAVVAISRAFGTEGSRFTISLIIAIAMTGWFGFQTSVCASSFNMIMEQYIGAAMPFWISCIIWGVAMFITSVFGVVMIKVLNYISVPILFVFLVVGVIVTLRTPGSAEVIANFVPAESSGMVTGIMIAIGGFAAGAVVSGDFTRYSKSRKDTVRSSIVGVLPAGIGALVIGGLLAISSGSFDITIMFSNIGVPIIGLIVLIAATWTTNTGNAYFSGIAVVNIFKLSDDKRSIATLICGAIGTVLAVVGIIFVFVPFLSFLSSVIPPVAGVAIADYWIAGRGDKDKWEPFKGVNWLGVIAWVCGAAFALLLPALFIPTINAILIAIVVYVVLAKVVKSPKVNPFAAQADES